MKKKKRYWTTSIFHFMLCNYIVGCIIIDHINNCTNMIQCTSLFVCDIWTFWKPVFWAEQYCRWVREFLDEENQGLDALIDYLSFRLLMMRHEQRLLESHTSSEEKLQTGNKLIRKGKIREFILAQIIIIIR